MNAEKIEQHVEVYEKYLALCNEKRDLIAKYKDAKDNSKK
jgi:hypothetical protein